MERSLNEQKFLFQADGKTSQGGGSGSGSQTDKRPPPSFPTQPKRTDSSSKTPEGKTKYQKKRPGQIRLPW